jgi:hypothetical protein
MVVVSALSLDPTLAWKIIKTHSIYDNIFLMVARHLDSWTITRSEI